MLITHGANVDIRDKVNVLIIYLVHYDQFTEITCHIHFATYWTLNITEMYIEQIGQ